MRIPLALVREYVDLRSPAAELAERLTSAAAEVKRVDAWGIPDTGANLDRFRVGRVLEATGGTTLRVDLGDGGERVASSPAGVVATGLLVAVGLRGGILPDGIVLDPPSGAAGTVLSGAILGLDPLPLVWTEPAEPGTALANSAPVAHEVLVVAPPSGRPDLRSAYGLARELAALYRLDLRDLPALAPPPAACEGLDVEPPDPGLHGHEVACVLRDVRVGTSPLWLRLLLAASGRPAASNVLDCAAYAQVALGGEVHVAAADDGERTSVFLGCSGVEAGRAAAVAARLLEEIAGARRTGQVELRRERPPTLRIPFRRERVADLTGCEIPAAEQEDILRRLGFDLDGSGTVGVPEWRTDVVGEETVVREVARVHGFDSVPETLPKRRALFGHLTRGRRLGRAVEDALLAAGLVEVYTPSFVAQGKSPDVVSLALPLSTRRADLRPTLLDSLVESARENARRGREDVGLFEIARIYRPSGEQLPREIWRAGGIVAGGYGPAARAVEYVHCALGLPFAVAETVEPFLAPGRAAVLSSGGGWLGELRADVLPGTWGVFELDQSTLYALVTGHARYEDAPRAPALRRDLGVVVAEAVPAGEIAQTAAAAAGSLLAELEPFDVYRGGRIPDGHKSVGLHLAFRARDRTLTGEEADALVERISAALGHAFGASVRPAARR